MRNTTQRNPDSDFVLCGDKISLVEKNSSILTNTEKTSTSKNLNGSLKISANSRLKPEMPEHHHHQSETVPTIDDLERSLSKLKGDLKNLNNSLSENYCKSLVFARDSYDANQYRESFDKETELESEEEDEELTRLMQSEEKEAVSHMPPDDPTWFSDPKHLTTSMGHFPTAVGLGLSTRAVSPTSRRTGLFGTEMATKNIDAQLTPADLSASCNTFPVRLTAPHIVGVRSLRPPTFTVRKQNSKKKLSSSDEALHYARTMTQLRDRSPSPRPIWKPNSKSANACAEKPPEFKKKRIRPRSLSRPATAIGYRDSIQYDVTPPRNSFSGRHSVKRQIHPTPLETELSYLKSADEIDTRKALIENSPYQEELAKLRLQRLRVEEEYLLQLKRESELERIRGPKKQWYSMKGPEFHYECNKNTALQKNKKSWGSILEYRDKLLESSREFSTAL